MNSSLLRAHLALFAVAIIYGLNYSFAKDVLNGYIQPLGFILLRVLGAGFLFWIISFFVDRGVPKKRDLGRFALCGVFGVAMNQMFFFSGLSLTTPINASIIMTTNPILVMIVAAFLIRERITPMKLAGIVLGFAGAVWLMLGNAQNGFGFEGSLGDLFILINAMSYGIYLVLVKPLMLRYSPLTVIRWVFTFGLLYVLPLGFSQFQEIEFEGFSQQIWLEVLFVIIFTTFLTYLLNVYALKKVSPTVVSFYIYLQPLIASMAAILMGQDDITLVKVLSTLLIFVGVYLVGAEKLFNRRKA
ncbi:DMT family transporter [Salibacteraceae bacterium]|nr:DMT family transporter [Salibacteraceae bacterium]